MLRWRQRCLRHLRKTVTTKRLSGESPMEGAEDLLHYFDRTVLNWRGGIAQSGVIGGPSARGEVSSLFERGRASAN
eukprot:3180641-Alexandrium_andersonii.AAC.1